MTLFESFLNHKCPRVANQPMALHLICLTSNGLPIFNRKFGSCENVSPVYPGDFPALISQSALQLPFSTIGSLNGVHMFCKNQGVHLNKTHLDDGLIVWQEFDDNYLFIGIAGRGVQEKSLRLSLELAYHAIILLVGQNGLQMCQNPERLKRELKQALPIVDQLLMEVDSGLIGFTECILSNENQVLLEKLNEFSEQFGSPYASLIVRNKIAVATEGWWELDAVDRKLLNITLQTSNKLDLPVYLPKKSPNVRTIRVSVDFILIKRSPPP